MPEQEGKNKGQQKSNRLTVIKSLTVLFQSRPLLDGNRQADVLAEGLHHGSSQRTRGESEKQDVQHAEEGGGRHIRNARIQEDAVLEKIESL